MNGKRKFFDHHLNKKRLLTLIPASVFIAIMIVSIVLGLAVSGKSASPTSINTTQHKVTVVVVVSGNTTYTSTLTSCSPFVIVQPQVIIYPSTTVTTTATLTSSC